MKPIRVGRSGIEAMSPTGADTPAGKSPGERRIDGRVEGKNRARNGSRYPSRDAAAYPPAAAHKAISRANPQRRRSAILSRLLHFHFLADGFFWNRRVGDLIGRSEAHLHLE